MIDEKKLIERFKHTPALSKITHNLIWIVEEQPKVGEWIPVSERLPPKPEEYHMHEKSYIVQERYVLEPYTAYWDGEKWKNILDDVLTDIIAWQPLPERYKEKTENNSNYMKKIMDKYSRNT